MMEEIDVFDEPQPRSGSRLSTVLVFLAAFAMMISWLGVYAITNALIAADVMVGWPRECDPRPKWMVNAFVGLFMLFAVVGFLFRWSSRRQLRKIDAIADG